MGTTRRHDIRGAWSIDELDEDADDAYSFDRDDQRPSHRESRRPRRAVSGKTKRAERSRSVVLDDEFEFGDTDDEISEALERKARERRRAEISEPFKCRHCRQFIGMPPTGGQQRNHCPMCLYSLHVDGRAPGDRASDCRSLMQPIGVFYRRNHEQALVHRCLGCGFERHNRVAADDNPLLLSELPLVEPPGAGASDAGV